MTGAPDLWTADEAARATGGQASGVWQATGVSIDTRSLKPGDLFVALKGPRFDGHGFVAQALEKGAAAVLVADAARVPEGAPCLVVEDTMAALQALGGFARTRTNARIVGVTGSVGKTTVKSALATVLAAQGATSANAASLNNHWGVPLSLARMARGARYAVLEMGMNHTGEIAALTALTRPHVALITTVAAVHRAHFASVEAIADAKAEIFAGVEPGGAAVLNRDNAWFAHLDARARSAGIGRCISFGRDTDAGVRLVEATPDADGSRVVADVLGRRLNYRVGLPGDHGVDNSLAVLAAVAALGADVVLAAQALAHVAPGPGRGMRLDVHLADGNLILVDDSYNASPISMAAALDVLGRTQPAPGGRRIAVLGDMLELGPDASRLHAELAPRIEANGVDLVYTAGPLMAALFEALPASRRGGHAADSLALKPLVQAAARAGDVVTVKGSAGSRMGIIVEAIRALAENAGTARRANGG